MKRTFTKSEAIEFLECNENTRPYRIIEGLEKCGFKNVEKVGRGDKVIYLCEQSDDTDEQCYYLFKDILINEFRYTKNFDYDLCLEIINFHINNDEYVTLEEIVDTIKVNTSPSTISRHRAKLSRKITNGIKTYGLVRNTDDCKKKPFAKDTYTQEIKDITDIYETMILNSFKTQLTKLSNTPKEIGYYATILYNKKKQDYKLIIVNRSITDDIKSIIDDMRNEGYEHKGTFVVWHNLLGDEPVINDMLYRVLFSVNLKTFGFDFITYKRIYRITKELEDDEEFLEIIKKAIKYKNK